MNIFVLMYNFPPIGAGRGIAWTKFCTKLSEKYNVTVFTIEPSKSDPLFNSSKLNLLDNKYKIIRTYPGKFYKKIYSKEDVTSINNLNIERKKNYFKSFAKKIYTVSVKKIFFPDRMILWNSYLKRAVLEESKFQKPDLIISVGFPFSTHILATNLKKFFKCKLILDYGDPWFFNPSEETIPSFRRLLDKIVERKVIKKSDYMTVTTKETLNKYIDSFPELMDKIEVVSQGVDTAVYDTSHETCTNSNIGSDEKVITMFYSGLFYEDIRNPDSFFKALQKFDFCEKFEIKLKIIIAGKMENYVFKMADSINNEYIEIIFLGNIDFSQVVEFQKNSDLLLFFGNLGSVQLPGKIFEYLATNRPIFSISDKKDYSTELIEHYNRGIVSNYDENEILKNLEKFIEDYLSKKYVKMERVKEFDWKFLSERYQKIVEMILEDY